MKRTLLSFLLSLIISAAAFAQTQSQQNTRPRFLGGDANEFRKWVDARIVYDPEAKAEGIQGRVMLQFTIEEDGTLDKVRVIRGVDPRLDAEAVRVVSSSPAWIPERQGGKAVPQTYTFPVIFKSDIPNPYPCDEFVYRKTKSGTSKLRIYSITHGTVALKTSDALIIIDPVMEMGGRKHQYGWFKPYKFGVILLTHEHPDHLDRHAIDHLCAMDSTDLAFRHNGPIRIFGSQRAVDVLGKGTAMENGDTVSIARNEIRIKAVPAYNTTRGHKLYHPKGNGNGYLIEIGDLVIYVAGDTEMIPEMKKLGKVDIALLPVNQPYTMTPEQCIKAARAINPKVFIPYHMGDTDMTPVIKEFEGSDIKVIFHEELR